MNLLQTYNSTKNNSDKEIYHKYISNFYNEKFSKFKNEEINILEIGILYGDSIKLWDDFFTKANIYGVDIQNAIKYNFSDKVNILFENAYCDTFIEKMKSAEKYFDIIIEDGPHTLETQSFFLSRFSEILNKNSNSMLILEDVYPREFEELKLRFPEFKILDLRSLVGGENNSVIFYKESEIS
jgi:hypothetical protein